MSRQNRPEMHRVIARTKDGRFVTHSSLASDWHTAQRVWNKLDEARRAGKLPLIEYLVVRNCADPDPRWKNAEYSESALAVFFVGRVRPITDRTRAFKKWGLGHGYIGKPGGWIYDADRPQAKPYYQGWDSLAHDRRLVQRGEVVVHFDHTRPAGRRRLYFVNDFFALGQPEHEEVAV